MYTIYRISNKLYSFRSELYCTAHQRSKLEFLFIFGITILTPNLV